MISRFVGLGLLILIVGSTAAAADITTDTLQTVKERIDGKKAVLVDVREKDEWDKGHIDGTIFLPLSELRKPDKTAALLKDVPKDKIVYTHCMVGYRSRRAADVLQREGYDVRALKEGYPELLKAGFPDAKAK